MNSAADRRLAGTVDYQSALESFRIEDLVPLFSGDMETSINACVECCDRHATSGAIALEWESLDGRRARYTFAKMQELSARFAGMLVAKGVKAGDVVAGMLPRIPELMITILGTWRVGAVYMPLFTAFGPKAIEHRLHTGGARLVVTDQANRPKLAAIENCPAVVVVGRPDDLTHAPGDFNFHAELAIQSGIFEPVLRKGRDLFMLLCTSGTTGLPKPVPVPLFAMLAFHIYMRDAIDLRPEDKFWNIADSGWAYGLYYAVTGPLLLGHATTFYDGPFSVETTYAIIRQHGITNLAGSPTAFRMLVAAGTEAAAPIKGQLRVISSAGEPLNPEVVRWFADQLAAPICDHYGQTEVGMVVNNHHRLIHPRHPGCAGFGMPGFRVVVLDEQGLELGPRQPGGLAIDIAASPLLFFEGYLHQDTPAIGGGYYRTGDEAELNPDGSLNFIGRADDVITSSGYRIGPFDVESALIEHPAVIEAAVIGKPDPERTEVVKAFVVLGRGYEANESLAEELRQHVKRRLSAHAYPREIEFREQLPKTASGKLQRGVLKNSEIAKQSGESRKTR